MYNFMLKNFVYLNLWDMHLLCQIGYGNKVPQKLGLVSAVGVQEVRSNPTYPSPLFKYPMKKK